MLVLAAVMVGLLYCFMSRESYAHEEPKMEKEEMEMEMEMDDEDEEEEEDMEEMPMEDMEEEEMPMEDMDATMPKEHKEPKEPKMPKEHKEPKEPKEEEPKEPQPETVPHGVRKDGILIQVESVHHKPTTFMLHPKTDVDSLGYLKMV